MLAVLQQILQHSDLPDKQRTVCRLLCTSKVINDAVCEHCTGRLPVTFSFCKLQQAKQFAVWLKTHAQLLRSLNIQLAVARSVAGPNTLSATDLIAEALQFAATTHPAGLQLQEVKLQELHCTLELLQQLRHSTQLTSLELQLCQRPSDSSTSNFSQLQQQPERYQPLVPALAGLTSLHRLNLHSNTPLGLTNNVEVLAPALSALTRLTALQIAAAHPAAVLQLVPQQLQQLHLFPTGLLREVTAPASLQLDHLTALTLLDNSREISHSQGEPRLFCQLVVRDGDTLPANLQVLAVRDVRSASPFEQLGSLKKLMLSDCSVSAADTRLIASHCRHLQEVELWYATATIFDEVSPAWKQLPVTGLHITSSMLSANTIQHVASLRDCLQCLDIRLGDVTATAEQMAAALAQLTQLHTLQLQLTYESGCRVFMPWAMGVVWYYGQPSREQDVVTASRDFVVSHAIASLPKLTDLLVSCASPHVPGARNVLDDALFPLCTATQITTLKLARCGVTSHVLQCLVAKLTGLRSLSITHDRIIDGSCLKCIDDNLHNLECLDLTGRDVTMDDCLEQQASGHLQGVHIRVSRKQHFAECSVDHMQDIAN